MHRAPGCATPTSCAGRVAAGPNAAVKLTLLLDHRMGAGHKRIANKPLLERLARTKAALLTVLKRGASPYAESTSQTRARRFKHFVKACACGSVMNPSMITSLSLGATPFVTSAA